MTVKEIWKSNNVYYATGGLSSSSFPTLWTNLMPMVSSGDTIRFKAGEYITPSRIVLNKPNIMVNGDVDANGRPISFIRSSASTIAVDIFRVTAGGCVIADMGFSGLGASDKRDQLQSYDLVVVKGADSFIMDNCILEHHHQYLLEIVDCPNYKVSNSVFRYGQNGIATSGTKNKGIIEDNLIHDISQGSIKLRGDTGTIVRRNVIREEYTYWRGFDHLRVPGPDGRGVVGNTQGCQGIYFGVTDPQPNFNCEVYGNTITDASIHGTVNIIDVVDGTSRKSPPNSSGCWFPLDAGTIKSIGNKFYGNKISGAYYGVNIQGYPTRTPNPLTVCDNNTFISTVKNQCDLVKCQEVPPPATDPCSEIQETLDLALSDITALRLEIASLQQQLQEKTSSLEACNSANLLLKSASATYEDILSKIRELSTI